LHQIFNLSENYTKVPQKKQKSGYFEPANNFFEFQSKSNAKVVNFLSQATRKNAKM